MKKPMRTVNEAEVKENLDALLDEVTQGAEIAITRRGKEVARLVPVERQRISREEFLRRAEDLVREDRDR